MDHEKPTGPLRNSPSPAGAEGAHNPSVEDLFRRLQQDLHHPKPGNEAIAAALNAVQRLTTQVDTDASAGAVAEAAESRACLSCGSPNPVENRFCAICGVPQQDAPPLAPEAPSAAPARPAPHAPGQHHYHHHYHHHYFEGGVEGGLAAPRVNAPESAREADRMRIAAAAKGEPMSRSEAAVRRLTQEWVLACNTRQLDELLDLYAPDALVLRSNLPLLRGAAAVREFFFSALEAGLGEVELEPIRVEVVGDLAHEVGRYSALVPGTTGKRREERGKYLWVFAKQSGSEWKLRSA